MYPLSQPYKAQVAKSSKGMRIADLPSELLFGIFSLISPTSLALVSRTCKKLREIALDDRLWYGHVQRIIPYGLPTQPPSDASWREVFISKHPYWFLPRYKIWIGDDRFSGELVIARYCLSRDVIEAYTLRATDDPQRKSVTFWPRDPEVLIASFNPSVALDLETPVLTIDGSSPYAKRISNQNMMPTFMAHLNSNGPILVRKLPEEAIDPGTVTWPPQTLPALSRVRGASRDGFRSQGHRPKSLEEMSEHAFRLRFSYQNILGAADSTRNVIDLALLVGIGVDNAMQQDPFRTFATLPPASYTPTKRKPYRGIWVGDYSGHGCEFIAFLQPDSASELSAFNSAWDFEIFGSGKRSSKKRRKDSIVSENDGDEQEEAVGGPLIGVKLTGDVNIPRGQDTFIVPDMSRSGTIRIANEDPFAGARVVAGFAHIAGRAFSGDGYIPAQIFLISHDRIAMWWERLGHISYFVRVNIEDYVTSHEV